MVVQGIPKEGVLQWNLNYKDSETGFGYSSNIYAYANYADLAFENNHSHNITINIIKDDNEPESDVTYFTTLIEKCQLIQPGKVFIRNWKYISFFPFPEDDLKYSMIYFTPEGKLFTNSAHYLSSSMANLDFSQVGDYIETNENYNIYLNKLYTIIDNMTADIDIYLNYIIDNEIKKVHLGTYFVPEIINSTYYSAELMGLNEISFDCSIPKSMNANVSVSGKIFYTTDRTVVGIDEQVLFSSESMTEKEIYLSDGTQATFSAYKIKPSITADCSATELGIKAAQEILAENFEISNLNMSNSIRIHFRENEMFKFLHILIPAEFHNTCLGIISPSGNIFRFLFKENKTTISENFFFFNVSSNNYIDIPIRRREIYDEFYTFQFEFFKLGSSEFVILDNTQGWDIEFDDDKIQRAFIIPTLKGASSIIFKGIKNTNRADHSINLDDNTCLYFQNYTEGFIGNCTIFLSYSYISDSQPSITIDLSYMKPLLDENENFSFTIYCNNGKEIMVTKPSNLTISAPIVNGISNIFLDEVGLITFTPICFDKTGVMCQITYDPPSQTGYHLIRYQDRDGISTTGSGFLAEAIPVFSNQSFVYYKTFKGALMTYREYPPDPITVKMVVDDLDMINGYDDPHRKMCLVEVDKPFNKIPFSRKYFIENILDFVDLFAVKRDDFDITHFENDEDGCILFSYIYIDSDDIKEPPAEACDLPITGEITVDTTNLLPNFVEKTIKKKNRKMIIAVSVVCSVVGAALIGAVVYCVLRSRGDIEVP